MAGTTSKINICSNALLLLGHTSISSLTDGTTGAELANALYDVSYEALLSKYRWRFATKQMQLAKTSDTPLGFDYTNVFQLPIDMLYLQQVHGVRNYEIYDDKLYTNATIIKVDYTVKVAEDKLPPYFIKMLEFYLASQFAIPITGNNTRADFYARAFADARMTATNLDSSQRPNKAIKHNPFIDARK